jgi:nucleotide-binding universal stress UspA family protein
LNTKKIEYPVIEKERHFLIAIDKSENTKRAVLYVAGLLGGQPGIRVTILNIIPEPPEDFFNTNAERVKWLEERKLKANRILENYRSILIQSGFREKNVAVKIEVRPCPSIAECILDIQKELCCCTVVIGRRGISKKEEFIFGSTSNKILHTEKNCAIWIVE